jgi:hypothetical protein
MANHGLSYHSDRAFDWTYREPDLADDNVLAIAYAISEGAITFIGPAFWMCLVLLFLVAELGG